VLIIFSAESATTISSLFWIPSPSGIGKPFPLTFSAFVFSFLPALPLHGHHSVLGQSNPSSCPDHTKAILPTAAHRLKISPTTHRHRLPPTAGLLNPPPTPHRSNPRAMVARLHHHPKASPMPPLVRHIRANSQVSPMLRLARPGRDSSLDSRRFLDNKPLHHRGILVNSNILDNSRHMYKSPHTLDSRLALCLAFDVILELCLSFVKEIIMLTKE
jgi:hypothetical protein